MSWIDQILQYLSPLIPLVERLIVFITPIYIAIGEVFSSIALAFIQILPSNSFVLSFIIAGVFVVLGIVFGVISEKKQKEKTEAGLVENEFPDAYSSTGDSDGDDDNGPISGPSTYFGAN